MKISLHIQFNDGAISDDNATRRTEIADLLDSFSHRIRSGEKQPFAIKDDEGLILGKAVFLES